MINLLNKLIYYTLFLLLISACTQKSPAPIVIKTHAVYNRQSLNNKNRHENYRKSPKQFNNNIGVSYVTVVKGDTIYDIAKKNNLLIRDIIEENNLEPPYILRIGDKLILPQNDYHEVVAGDNLYYISRAYGMNINDLIKINHLEVPYTIKAGDKLKISGSPSFNKVKTSEVASDYQKPSTTFDGENFIWPIEGEVVSKFGHKSGGLYNDGINIKAQNNQLVKASRDGVIAYVGNELRGYGNLIIIKHSNNWISAYAHLDQSKVKRGDKVTKGSIIATAGSTGNVDYPQLYFGIRKGREAVNPEKYLKS